MILPVHRVITRAIVDAVQRQYGVTDVPAFAIEVPPTRVLGDLAITVAFQLARTLRKPPRVIAMMPRQGPTGTGVLQITQSTR